MPLVKLLIVILIMCFLQLLDLCNIHGPSYLVLPAKAKHEFLYGLQEASKLDMFNPAERRHLTEIGKTLIQFWG